MAFSKRKLGQKNTFEKGTGCLPNQQVLERLLSCFNHCRGQLSLTPCSVSMLRKLSISVCSAAWYCTWPTCQLWIWLLCCFVAFTLSRHLISWRQDSQCAFTVLPLKHGGMPRPKQMHIPCQLHEWSSPSKNDNDLKPEFQLQMDSDKHDHLFVCWRIRQKQFQTDIIIWPFDVLYSQSHYLITPFFCMTWSIQNSSRIDHLSFFGQM